MTLYLTAAPDRLAQARAATAQLAHAAYRIGLGSQLLAAPLPAALRGGLMVVSDRQAPTVEQPEPLARQLVRVCLRRGFSGVVLDLEELPEGRWAEDRAALIRQLAPLLGAYGRRLYVPEIYAAASPETVVLLCTALSGGSLQGRLEETCAAYGAQRLALDYDDARINMKDYKKGYYKNDPDSFSFNFGKGRVGDYQSGCSNGQRKYKSSDQIATQ